MTTEPPGVTVFFRDPNRAFDALHSIGLTTRQGGLRVDDAVFVGGLNVVRLEVGEHVFQVPIDAIMMIHFKNPNTEE